MYINRIFVLLKQNRLTRMLCCCFITFGVYMVYTYEVSRTNTEFDIDGAKAVHGLVERRKYRKDLLSKSNSDIKLHRTPNAIIIGAGKCGTATLLHFLQQHPLIQCFLNEAHYFDHDINKGVEYYKRLLPAVSKHEILMEKTPAYFSALQPDVPDVMNRECPGVKLILLLCNPVDRLFSSHMMQYKKHLKGNFFKENNSDVANDLFEKKVAKTILPLFHEKMKRSEDELFCPEDYYRELYICQIRRWMKSFSLERILILDGEELLHDPGAVINKVQDYLQVPRVLRKSDFVRNPVSGMFCVRPWWDENYNFKAEKAKKKKWYENLICMWPSKGVTRSETSNYGMKKSTRLNLEKLYKPYNERLFKLLNRTFNW